MASLFENLVQELRRFYRRRHAVRRAVGLPGGKQRAQRYQHAIESGRVRKARVAEAGG